jgi:hypothetical protein
VLGLGLIILGIAGLYSPGGNWIAWLDIVGGLISFFAGVAAQGAATPALAEGTVRSQQYGNVGGMLFLCLGLFAMWIIGLVTKSVTATMVWWNFAFACAYGLLAMGFTSRHTRMRRVSVTSEGRDQGPRRVA